MILQFSRAEQQGGQGNFAGNGARLCIAVKLVIYMAVMFPCFALAQDQADPLWRGFQNPPNSSRPLVWWHWMNGNITREGIKLDLEWMHRVGLGGFQNFDVVHDTPQVVQNRLAYMTPEWKDAFKYAIALGDQFGMEMGVAGSPGWSESGGPWVPASQGMKKYVWSETLVEGGKPFTGILSHPPSNSGAFQTMPVADVTSPPPGAKPIPQFYADSVVIAYRKPRDEIALETLRPKMTASGGSPDFAILTDGDLENTTKLPVPKDHAKSAWIQYEFAVPQTIRAFTIVVHELDPFSQAILQGGATDKVLEASDDGESFHVVATLPADKNIFETSAPPEYTVAFPPETAKYFRVSFKPATPPSLPEWAVGIDPILLDIATPKQATDYEIAELVLHAGARVNRWEQKAAFVPTADLYSFTTPAIDPEQTIPKAGVVDLTARMHPDGTLDWTPPPGEWVVLRFGYSLLGIRNHPATAEATGLEVDKLDRRYVKEYFEKYLNSYRETVGSDEMGKRGIWNVVNDSWEAGSQNWTDDMIEKFKRLRGYDPSPWMPVLAGRVVESAEASDRFLWDFRRTIADLIANEHYGELEEVLHEHGMAHYGESHEEGRNFVADGMEVKKFNEVPMSAMWAQIPGVNKDQYGYDADDRESASVAHIYGQNLAAAESMTAAAAPWAWSPATLKPTADMEFLNGINRFVISESVHQPLVGVGTAPGLTLGPYGQWFNRNETWADQAGPWVDYLARTSFLLQQGHFGADLIYFYGEDSNLTALFGQKAPEIPEGYGFDYINADGLLHELSVSDGLLVTKSGMQYRVLGLDANSVHMSLPVLREILKLVEDGAVVVGPKPTDDPSLSDDQGEFRKLTDALFGDGTGVHTIGKGSVYAGQTVSEVFAALNLKPDFEYTRLKSDTHLEFVHRKLDDGDLYFVDNRGDHAEAVDATFRVGGRAPELWRAETGTAKPASYHSAGGRTTVPLELEPWGTVFVVFRKPTSATSRTVPKMIETKLADVEGPWQVGLEPGRGAPSSVTLQKLASWSDSTNAGVKYFSGAGTYTRTVQAPASWFKKGTHLWIDLGDVKNLADVTINGEDLGTVWHAPYRIDATSALKPGMNELQIKVVNAWVNRMIGDEQPGARKYTFADVKPYSADSPLQKSGLLGPVRIYSVDSRPVKPLLK